MKQMDFHPSKAEGRRPVSVLDGEGSYFHRILSREPSVGNSGRYNLYRNPGQIPFQWEKQPGKCKFEPPKKDPGSSLPRISPPPISSSKSMELPSRPNRGGGLKGSCSSWSKMKIWRMIKTKKLQLAMPRSKNQARGSEVTSKCSSNGSSCTSSDDNRMSSSSNSSSSTSSSSTASCLSFAAPLQLSNMAKGHSDWPF
ncbi:uncharacterized protein LOC115677475 [Syzygium oleosum]|uniref:uncharacterized protein LOC115677475 n=1 Tax=Syzygium oleosum TaxID=219896 RepID=UPI0011D18FC2|nr:uncharacterized protein LOC115677475 [Syzygium oleosum]